MITNKKIWIGAVIVVVIIVWGVLTWFVFRAPGAGEISLPVATTTTASNTATTTGAVSVTETGDHTAGAQTGASSGSPQNAAHVPTAITAPVANAQWVFEQQNTIQWNKAANITGGIYLVNAATGATVGWILQQTGPSETSFPWNTRDLVASRTNPTKTTVTAGRYVIKVMFDSPEDPTLTSAPFSIIYPNQVQVPNYNAAITRAVFAPTSLTVAHGAQIVITNNDATAYQILVSGYSPFTIAAGSTYTFNTTSLSAGPYVFYSSSYPSLRMTVTMQ